MGRQPRTWSLDTAIERVPGGIVVSPRGRIGDVTADSFAKAITAARAEAPRVVIDLEGVDYISGRGVMVLRQAASTDGGRDIICGLREPVRITLDLAGLLSVLSIEATRADAIEKLKE
jgi:stage II sporulation protein AA (anti-sigma F factor antagonist)